MQISLRGLFATEASIHDAIGSHRAKTREMSCVCLH
jgi:hypothetical protein